MTVFFKRLPAKVFAGKRRNNAVYSMSKEIMANGKTRYIYDTLSEAVNDLQQRGYTTDFLLEDGKECLYCKTHPFELSPNEFVIDEIYRFEGMTDPADESIVFAISSEKYGVKGLVINSFGAEFGYRSSKLVEELHRRARG